MRQADVTSIDAIHAFRSHFVRYLAEAGVALDLATETVVRTRVWLQSDQRTHWERELRQRGNTLAMARQQLLSARLTPELRSTDVARRDVLRAERAVAEAEQKLTSVRLEARRYDSTVASKLRELDRLRMFITGDGLKAAASLTAAVNALHDYAATQPAPLADEAPAAASPTDTPKPIPTGDPS